MATNVSSISQALAGSLSTFPTPYAAANHVVGKDHLAKAGTRITALPTPPNSISPNLPPHGFRAKAVRESATSPPFNVDSDIDLQDAVDHANSRDQPQRGMSSSDASGPDDHGHITPAFLAKHHLPAIILDKGPIAIRHVMNQLAQVVPGFADVPPAKARRIVVGALEGRHGGGLKGEVEFEKVGWGRWDARIKGQPMRENRIYSIQEGNMSPPTSADSPYSSSAALRIPGGNGHRQKPRRPSHGSWTADSTMSSHSEQMDVDMAEFEADKMSIDGDDDNDTYPGNKLGAHRQQSGGSDTDEEDWASMGAAALRGQSYTSGGGFNSFRSRRGSSIRAFPRSMPSNGDFHQFSRNRKISGSSTLDFSGVDVDSQEKEAIEALMRMGSM